MENSAALNQLNEAITSLVNENVELRESVDEVRQAFDYEDRFWELIGGIANGEHISGLELDEVKNISQKARARIAGSSLVKHAADLHYGYVFGNGVEFAGVLREQGTRGAPSNEVRFYEKSANQESIFSAAAMHELQYARFADGNVLAYCDTSKKVVRRVPISEITNIMVDQDYPEIITAYLRQWNTVDPTTGETRVRKEWAYTNRFEGNRQTRIKLGDENIPVSKNVTVVDLRANRQVGWTLGVPDATAGLHWVEAYGEVLQTGRVVTRSLGKVVYKVVQKTKKGAANVGVQLGKGGQGQTAVVGEGQDLQLVNSAQASYNFNAALPLASMAAAAWNVSVVDLTSSSASAGSSYGSAQALVDGVRNAMNGVRAEWTQFFQDIFQVMGMGRIAVSWPPMEKPDAYRQAQEWVLYRDALTEKENRAIVLDRLDIAGDPNTIPDTLRALTTAAKQAASPGQGQSNGTGGQDSAQKSDLDSSGVTENLRHEMAMQDVLREMRELVSRIPNPTD